MCLGATELLGAADFHQDIGASLAVFDYFRRRWPQFSGEQRSSVMTLGLSGGDDLGSCAKHGYITGEGILLYITVSVYT